jgi:hypothetical protein
VGRTIEPDGVTLNASDLLPDTPFPTINKEVSSPSVLYFPDTCWYEPDAIVLFPSACEYSPCAIVLAPSACEPSPIA